MWSNQDINGGICLNTAMFILSIRLETNKPWKLIDLWSLTLLRWTHKPTNGINHIIQHSINCIKYALYYLIFMALNTLIISDWFCFFPGKFNEVKKNYKAHLLCNAYVFKEEIKSVFGVFN